MPDIHGSLIQRAPTGLLIWTISPTFAVTHRCRLVLQADEVVGELLNGLAGVAGNGGLAVVTEEDGLGRLGDRNALAALREEESVLSCAEQRGVVPFHTLRA